MYKTPDRKSNYIWKLHLIIIMIDMSNTFDTVNRKTLFEKLETILDESETRMMYIHINNVKLKVRAGRS